MNIFLIIAGVLGIIAGIVVPIILNVRYENSYRSSTPKPNLKPWRWVLIASIVVFLFGHAFKIIPTGYTGVRTTFGQISDRPVSQGIAFQIPFVQSVKTVNNKQQDVKFESEIWGETANKTPVYAADIVVTYQISAGRSAWIYTNVSDVKNLISQDIVASATKSAMVDMNESEVTNRAKIEPMVKEKLVVAINEKYGEGTITILKVTINQMDFEEAYNQAIQQKSLAQQKQEQQKIENQTAIEKAEADKKVAIANAEAKAEADRIAAEAQAEVTKINAEADAAATKIAADAEAEANNKIRDSLTEEVLKAMFYEAWNGELPDAMGSDTIITDITP